MLHSVAVPMPDSIVLEFILKRTMGKQHLGPVGINIAFLENMQQPAKWKLAVLDCFCDNKALLVEVGC